MNAELNSSNRKAILASNYATKIRGRHAALWECTMYKQLNYTRTRIPSDTRSNAKVDVCVVLVVLRGCQSTKKRPLFLSRTSIFFSSRRVVAE